MWRPEYTLDDPITLPAGSTIHGLAEYDNTPDNPYNPAEPSIDMTWGPHMFQEMFLVHFGTLQPVLPVSQFSVEPVACNVNSDQVILNITSESERTATVSIFNSEGILTIRQAINIRAGSIARPYPVDITSLPAGNYVVDISQDAKSLHQSVFVRFAPDDTL